MWFSTQLCQVIKIGDIILHLQTGKWESEEGSDLLKVVALN